MSKGGDKNYVSVWFWMFALFITALPCVGLLMVLYWAIAGENESRKNYFRALIAWGLILTGLWLGVMALGFWPEIQKQLQPWLAKFK